VVCGYCESACSGSADNRTTRPNEWRYYVCGKRNRERWDSCELSKIDAEKLEQAVVTKLSGKVLTEAYLWWLIETTQRSFSAEQLEKELAEKQAYLRQLDHAISSLVDAIERAPASTLAQRLVDREEERRLLMSEIAELFETELLSIPSD
jgi:hypothetical protein